MAVAGEADVSHFMAMTSKRHLESHSVEQPSPRRAAGAAASTLVVKMLGMQPDGEVMVQVLACPRRSPPIKLLTCDTCTSCAVGEGGGRLGNGPAEERGGGAAGGGGGRGRGGGSGLLPRGPSQRNRGPAMTYLRSSMLAADLCNSIGHSGSFVYQVRLLLIYCSKK